eukprot:scaffold3161_cov118-Isochrysis_galbana.AAC.6
MRGRPPCELGHCEIQCRRGPPSPHPQGGSGVTRPSAPHPPVFRPQHAELPGRVCHTRLAQLPRRGVRVGQRPRAGQRRGGLRRRHSPRAQPARPQGEPVLHQLGVGGRAAGGQEG